MTTTTQARRVLEAFERWILESPGRRVVLTADARGLVSRLEESRESHGRTLVDAAAQSAQVLVLDMSDLAPEVGS